MGNEGVRPVCRQANKIRDFCAFCVRLNEDCTFRTRFFGNKSNINLSLIFASPYLRLRRSIIWNKSLGGLSLSGGRYWIMKTVWQVVFRTCGKKEFLETGGIL